MMPPLRTRLITEALGTGLLVCTVVGSGIMASKLTKDTAVALLGNTLPTGAILVVLITMFAPISGAHFNPVVSLVMAIRRELPWPSLAPYVLVQIVGGCLGTIVAHAMFGLDLFQASTTARTGWPQWLAEFVAAFGLVLTIIGVIRTRPDMVAVAVGLYITAAYWFTASTSFANPAVTIARSLSNTFAGIAPSSGPLFIAAQIAGAVTAVLACGWLLKERREVAPPTGDGRRR
jgi:glycerol uptake facilitator-like aquaporin